MTSCGYVDSRAFKMAIESKNCEEAKSILLSVLRKKSDNQDAAFNLVHTFMCAGDLVSAQKQVDALIRSKSPYLFELYFLKGYIAGEIGEVDDALLAYQKALDIKTDQKIKKNMELLLQDSKSGKSGKKKKGKGKKQKDSQTDKNSKDNENDPEQKNENPDPNKPSDKDPKDEQSKKMTKKQTEKIMKEIDSEEKKVRSQGLKIKSKKGGSQNDKNW